MAQLINARGLVSASRRKGCRTTSHDAPARPALDLVERALAAKASNRLWVADIPHIPT